MPDDLFGGFMGFCDQIMGAADHGERHARKYKWLLGQISELLKTTHGMVVSRLEQIEDARQLEDAEQALAELNTQALEESFRLEGMCDTFEGLGNVLGNMASESEQSGELSANDVQAVYAFAGRLSYREQEVATIYTQEITEVADLLSSGAGDLQALQQRARVARVRLTDEMADFDAKARRFKRLSS